MRKRAAVVILGAVLGVAGCLNSTAKAADPFFGIEGALSEDLKTCREIARNAYYKGGKTKDAALAEYDACKARTGAR